jgi:hypothetical protein
MLNSQSLHLDSVSSSTHFYNYPELVQFWALEINSPTFSFTPIFKAHKCNHLLHFSCNFTNTSNSNAPMKTLHWLSSSQKPTTVFLSLLFLMSMACFLHPFLSSLFLMSMACHLHPFLASTLTSIFLFKFLLQAVSKTEFCKTKLG